MRSPGMRVAADGRDRRPCRRPDRRLKDVPDGGAELAEVEPCNGHICIAARVMHLKVDGLDVLRG
eukprot:829140-Prymnesium_polylepis.1